MVLGAGRRRWILEGVHRDAAHVRSAPFEAVEIDLGRSGRNRATTPRLAPLSEHAAFATTASRFVLSLPVPSARVAGPSARIVVSERQGHGAARNDGHARTPGSLARAPRWPCKSARVARTRATMAMQERQGPFPERQVDSSHEHARSRNMQERQGPFPERQGPFPERQGPFTERQGAFPEGQRAVFKRPGAWPFRSHCPRVSIHPQVCVNSPTPSPRDTTNFTANS
jgi:hypothetical protein